MGAEGDAPPRMVTLTAQQFWQVIAVLNEKPGVTPGNRFELQVRTAAKSTKTLTQT